MNRQIFTIYAQAVAQSRAGRKHYLFFDGNETRAASKAYDPVKSASWKNEVRMYVISEMNRQGMSRKVHTGPVVLDLFFYLPRPKTLPKKIRYHVRKPDRDNLEKGVKDALKGVLYKDDAQVFDGRTRKEYGDPPRVVIGVTLIDQDDALGDFELFGYPVFYGRRKGEK